MISKGRILSNLDIIVSSLDRSLNRKNSTLNPKLAKMDNLTAMIMMWNEDLMKFLNHSPESLDSSIFIILKQLCCLLIKMQKEFIPNHDFICRHLQHRPQSPLRPWQSGRLPNQGNVDVENIRFSSRNFKNELDLMKQFYKCTVQMENWLFISDLFNPFKLK